MSILAAALIIGAGTTAWQHYRHRGNAAPEETGQTNAPQPTNGSNANMVAAQSAKTAATPFIDSDIDGLSDDLETLYATDPRKGDTDADGYSDSKEVANGFDPTSPLSGKRMVDLGLVQRLSEIVPRATIVSSMVSTRDHNRYYLVFDGVSTSYYGDDGTVKAQCSVGVEPAGACATLPNELRTDFSRNIMDGKASDSFHVPF